MSHPFVTVVSGLPRSGTSLLMQMLAAGGIEPLTDGERPADDGNPRGYFELEAVKRLPSDAAWLADAPGRCVKVVHPPVRHLPEGPPYRVLWLRRDPLETVRSQAELLTRLGTPAEDGLSDERVAAILSHQAAETRAQLEGRPDVACLDLEHRELVHAPRAACERIAAFLGGGLDLEAMQACADPSLHRVRLSGNASRDVAG